MEPYSNSSPFSYNHEDTIRFTFQTLILTGELCRDWLNLDLINATQLAHGQ